MSETTQDIPLTQRYNQDSFISQDITESTYDQQPITNYGIKMLENMGWHENLLMGKNQNNAQAKVIEASARMPRQGLGADPKPIFRNKYQKKYYQQQQKEKEDRMALIYQKDKNVQVVKGKHQGLTGIIISSNEQLKEAYVQLDISEQIIKASHSILKIIHDKQQKIQSKKDRSRSKEKEKVKEFKKKLQDEYSDLKEKEDINYSLIEIQQQKLIKSSLNWVIPNIKVRVIQKKSKYYNQKVVINDIIDHQTFTAITEDNEILENLREKDLETVIPQSNKKIVFVSGEMKSQIGILQSKDKKTLKALIQIDDTLELVYAKLDDICEIVFN